MGFIKDIHNTTKELIKVYKESNTLYFGYILTYCIWFVILFASFLIGFISVLFWKGKAMKEK